MKRVIPTMILAAGRGERLRPLTDHTPKPLLPVAGKPLIERQIEQLAAAGVRDLVINLHHLGEQIASTLGNGERFGLSIRYSRESEKLETGGGLLNALPLLGDGPLWLLNGDVLLDLPLADFPTELPPGSAMHMLLTPTPAVREHGDFDFDGQHVTGWGEAVVYCCFALLHGSLVREFAQRHGGLTVFSMREVFSELIDQGRLTGQLYNGDWIDIGSAAQLQAATQLLQARRTNRD
ncbi:MAG: nucleotidyltransferase family protein [Pseudomonadales bacterium]